MRVAYFTADFLSPSVTFIMNQVTGLLQRGIDIHVYCGLPKQRATSLEVFDRLGLQGRIHFWPESRSQAIRALGGMMRGKLRRLEPIRMRSLMPYYEGRVREDLLWRSAMVQQDPPADVLVAHFGNMALRMQELRDLGAIDAPLITFFHGSDMSRFVDQRGAKVYANLFEKGALMLPISELWQRKLLDLGCPPEKLLVHRMGVDLKLFEFRPRTLPPGTVAQLFSVARLTEKKGLTYALEAMHLLRAQRRDFHYHVVGDGPLRGSLERKLQEYELSDFVTLHGWKSQEEVALLLREMHVCLAPSVTAADGDQEGVPVALMEAMAAGIPVVSTWHSGIPELVKDKLSGALVPERDPEALCAAVAQVLNTTEKWPEMTQAARAIVDREFNIERLNDQLVQRLTAVATGRPVH